VLYEHLTGDTEKDQRIILKLKEIYIIFVNCNWVVTRWQYTFTQIQYIEQHS